MNAPRIPPHVLIGRLAHVLRTASLQAQAGHIEQTGEQIHEAEMLLEQLRESV